MPLLQLILMGAILLKSMNSGDVWLVYDKAVDPLRSSTPNYKDYDGKLISVVQIQWNVPPTSTTTTTYSKKIVFTPSLMVLMITLTTSTTMCFRCVHLPQSSKLMLMFAERLSGKQSWALVIPTIPRTWFWLPKGWNWVQPTQTLLQSLAMGNPLQPLSHKLFLMEWNASIVATSITRVRIV